MPAIWKEADVRRDGLSIESVLEAMKEQGARAKLVVIDASRRNPYERRFRAFSHGLAPITAPDNALILSSATPGKVADDSNGQYSVLVAELLNNLNASDAGAETVFNKTRVAISRASDGEQVPSVSSSLLEDVRFGATATPAAKRRILRLRRSERVTSPSSPLREQSSSSRLREWVPTTANRNAPVAVRYRADLSPRVR